MTGLVHSALRWLQRSLPTITWTIKALQQLDPVAMQPNSEANNRERIDRALAATFRRAQTVIVLQLFPTYRNHTDRFILLADVHHGQRPSRYVVKIGLGPQAAEVRQEWEACQQCWPQTVHHDPMLMPVTEGCSLPGMSTLIYGDAEHFISPAAVSAEESQGPRPLAAAVLSCVETGRPSLTSVSELLFQLYERLACLLYTDATIDDSSHSVAGPHLCLPRIWDGMRRWHLQAGRTRLKSDRYRTVNMARKTADTSNEAASTFRDPVDYLEYIKKFTVWTVPLREFTGEKSDTGSIELGPTEDRPCSAEILIPSFWRGRSHGDLHGLNVLVGEIEGRVLWPAVFDYEHMRDDNYIGWDFVKLETELKIRALQAIYKDMALDHFPNHAQGIELARFANHVQEFEWGLHCWTEYCRGHRAWPRVGALPRGMPPQDRHPDAGVAPEAFLRETGDRAVSQSVEYQLARLRALVLEIRQRAARILGSKGRSDHWYREYLFLLMCYGVCCVRFDNQDESLLMAAFKSAGVAAYWLSEKLGGKIPPQPGGSARPAPGPSPCGTSTGSPV